LHFCLFRLPYTEKYKCHYTQYHLCCTFLGKLDHARVRNCPGRGPPQGDAALSSPSSSLGWLSFRAVGLFGDYYALLSSELLVCVAFNFHQFSTCSSTQFCIFNYCIAPSLCTIRYNLGNVEI
jgi:hypothetical protein